MNRLYNGTVRTRSIISALWGGGGYFELFLAEDNYENARKIEALVCFPC